MFWSQSFIHTLKEAPEAAESISHKLMLRASLIRMLAAGVYSYLPLGVKVLQNLGNIIRDEMDKAGACEVLLPALQPLDLWLKSGRDTQMGETMIRFTDRKGRKLCLGPTHEEVITDLVKADTRSYKQLPVILYQIQTKYRDELRPRFGVMRACEFIMKDAYSFDVDQTGLDKNYAKMFTAYEKIFKRCGLNFIAIQADCGVMGGDESAEFMVPAESGEDKVMVCQKCGYAKVSDESAITCPNCNDKLEQKTVIEIGHIFKLGTKYSQALEANFCDKDGLIKPIVMGCYGIGVSRLIAAIIEQNHDKDGIIWPREIAPYDALIIPLNTEHPGIKELASVLYKKLSDKFRVLLDDRDERPGIKFKDADLIGIPLKVIIGEKNLEKGKVEIVKRRHNESISVGQDSAASRIEDMLL